MNRTYVAGIALLVSLFSVGSITAQCTFTGLDPNYCTNSAASSLTPATSGGNFMGPGVSGSTFNPTLAGAGTHTITYAFCTTSYVVSSGAFAPNANTGTGVSLTDDATSGALPIGFNFQFFCNTYNTFYICSNGFITFNAGQGSPWTPTGIPSNAAPLNAIYFPWTDLNPGLGGTITYSTIGTAPNRKLLVSFNAVPHHNGGNGGDPVTVQLQLYETTNVIEIHTTTMPINSSASNHVMGLQNGSVTPTGTFVTGRNNTNNWSATNEMQRFTPGSSCSSSQTVNVSPSSILVAGTTSICAGATATLTASGNTTYTWSSSTNTSISSSSVANVSPLSTTVYSVSATNAFGCIASSAITVTVNSGTPTLSIASSTTQTCLGKTATLTASGALSYTWTNGVTNGVSFYPSATNVYTVSGQNGCGITTGTVNITIVPLPLSIGLTPALYCTNQTATLSATSPGTSYTWQPGNIVNTNPVMIVNPQSTTVYTITVSDGTCSGTQNATLVANPAPTIVASANSSVVCPGGSINLTATGGVNYTWSPGNQTGNSITVSPSLTTLYSVIGDNSAGCSASGSQVILVGAQPTLVLGASSSTICNGNSATLTVSGGDTYLWSNGPSTTLNIVSPTQPTVYTVVGTNSGSNCSETVSLSIDVFSPVLTISGSTAVCSGNSTSLTASGATSYTWEPGGIPFAGLTVAPQANTIYTLSAVSSSNNVNCPVTATVEVIVNQNPTVTASPAFSVVCAKQSNTITGHGAISYTWITTSTVLAATSITATSTSAAVFIYTLTGRDAQGCETTITTPLSFNACAGIENIGADNELIRVYPNPTNGDFVINGSSSLELRLMNALGQHVSNINLREDNNYSAKISGLAQGIYFVSGNKGSIKVIVTR